MPTSLPPNEDERLAALRRYTILDSEAEETFDRVSRIAARVCRAPIALVTFVDEHRQWVKASHGLERQEARRETSFCSHTILQNRLMVVPDAQQDARFMDNPAVIEQPGIGFYAGVPLTTSDGYNLGSLCVLDTAPRQGLSDDQAATLADLAGLVVEELELRLQNKQTFERQQQLEWMVSTMQDGAILYNPEGLVQAATLRAAELLRVGLDELLSETLDNSIWCMVAEDGVPLPPEAHPALASLYSNRPTPPRQIGVYRASGALSAGELIWLLMSAVPLNKGGGPPFGVVVNLAPAAQ